MSAAKSAHTTQPDTWRGRIIGDLVIIDCNGLSSEGIRELALQTVSLLRLMLGVRYDIAGVPARTSDNPDNPD